ncbi:YhgE/Pip family protein [Microbacteriaceae bacterium 4G12]
MSRWRKRSILALISGVPLVVAGLFVGALSQADTGIERVPAAIVNQDEMVQQTLPDGTQQPVLAGRLLVTELTSDDAQAFDWTITNEEQAEDMLSRGEVYAVLTVPENFSASITSLSQPTPERAELTVETDDAHGYLTGAATQAVGTGMVAVFGNDITAQYVNGVFTGFSSISGAFTEAAGGADQLSAGATSLGTGLDELTGGVVASQQGAEALADGVDQYTNGVDELSSGLNQLSAGASQLDQLSGGITQYTGGVGEVSAGLAQVLQIPALIPNPAAPAPAPVAPVPAQPEPGQVPADPAAPAVPPAAPAAPAAPAPPALVPNPAREGALQQIAAGLAELAAGGEQLNQGAAGIDQLQSGIAASASGAAQLSAGSEGLRDGATALGDGLGRLAEGASATVGGATGLATGATELADGLEQGAESIPSYTEDEAQDAAGVVADPITLTVERDNEVTDVVSGISSLVVPLGLWLGALAIFLALRPLARRALASPAPTGRLLRRSLGAALGIAVVQAVLLVVLLHTAVGIDWALLPVTLAFSLLMAGAFTAFHYLLTAAFGRVGLIVSLLLLAIQLTATGGLYPIELVASPFRAISPFLPLTYGVQGMQAIVAGGSAGTVVTAMIVLALFGVVCVLLSYLAVRRSRRASALGLVPATA